jgi:predicted AlkP superfamily phosphohydrolase/phosphomutase
LPELERLGYRVDSDPKEARAGRDRALADMEDALDKRARAFLHLIETQPWDLFLGVLMETDRLHHFFYDEVSDEGPVDSPAFLSIYGMVDRFLGQVLERLGDNDVLVLLSDHGSCTIRQEVYYNHWLAQSGYLEYAQTPARSVADLAPGALAYGMDPARIFVNLKGRERDGKVAPGAEYERTRTEIIEAAKALEITDGNGSVRPVVQAYRREEIYSGPYLEQAADVILAPRNGYDPKGAFYRESLTGRDGALVGMHSFDDAFVYLSVGGVKRESADLVDVVPTVLAMMDLPAPAGLDGVSLL